MYKGEINMAEKIKLVALDLDGTLVDHGGKVVTPRLIDAVKEAKKQAVEVVIATGRHRSTTLPIAEVLDVDHLITLNGGEIWTTRGELLLRQSIQFDDVQKIISQIERLNSHYWLVSDQGVFQTGLPDDYLKHEWIKFGFDFTDDNLRKEATNYFGAISSLELTNSSPTNIEINKRGTHKRQAIEYLLDSRKLDFDQVMAVGDSMNDIKMIERAGFGVAMGNAQHEVKERAKFVTKPFNEDGAAIAIEKMLMGDF